MNADGTRSPCSPCARTASFEPLPLSPRSLPALRHWAHCICAYVFDVELGPKLELEIPADTLADADKRLLGYLAFPDSNPRSARTAQHTADHEPETVIFSFRFRHGSGVTRGGVSTGGTSIGLRRRTSNSLHAAVLDDEPGVASERKQANPSAEYSCGVACFRQQFDASRPRHCIQRSVVIVSPHNYVSFLSRVMGVVGPLFFRYGAAILESVLHSMASWPEPALGGVRLELPLAGEVLDFTVPAAAYGGQQAQGTSLHHSAAASSPGLSCVGLAPRLPRAAQRLLGNSFPVAGGSLIDVDDLLDVATALGVALCSPMEVPRGPAEPQRPFSSLWPLVEGLWALWEIALCGEPLLIYSPDYPTRVADAVLAVIGLIAPLEYAGDFRPYFTIYDGDFEYYRQHVQRHSISRTALIVGASNPVVLRVFGNIPTCVVFSPVDATGDGVNGTANGSTTSLPQKQHEVVFRSGPGNWLQRTKLAGDNAGDRGFTLPPDTHLLRSLALTSNSRRGSTVAQSPPSGAQAEARDGVLRRHFFELTLTFLRPFLPFLEERNGLEAASPLVFDESAFLKTFQPVGIFASLPRQRCKDLYARFLSGANFRPWFAKLSERALTGGTTG